METRYLVDGERVPFGACLKDIVIVHQMIGGGGDNEGAGGESDDAPITLRVREQTGEEMMFKVKKTTKMEKILKAFAERKGIALNAFRFVVDGNRIQPTDTPKMLELDDNDQIDVRLETVGGGENEESSAGSDGNIITVCVKDQSGEEMFFKVKKDTAMKKIFSAYASRKGMGVEVLHFFYDGDRIKDDETPKTLELEEGDQIDVTLHQTGGAGETEDQKPNVASNTIMIAVSDPSTGEKVSFKIKKDTEFSKVFEAYAQRKGVAVNSYNFQFDGHRVRADSTPKMIEMGDGDVIEAFVQQIGGGP